MIVVAAYVKKENVEALIQYKIRDSKTYDRGSNKEAKEKTELLWKKEDRAYRVSRGRAAEMVFHYGLTYGPAVDLEMATSMAANMVCKWGMYEEEIGLAVIGGIELKYDEKAKELINRILSEQLKEAIRIIELNKDAMKRLVTKVMDSKQKYLTKKEIQEAAGELNH